MLSVLLLIKSRIAVGGGVSGPIFDRGYVRELLIGGSALTVFGIMMLSLAKEYYQILLAQGLCVGIGSAMLYIPSITLITLRFQRHRAMAVFVAKTGTAVGLYYSLVPKFCCCCMLTLFRWRHLPHHILHHSSKTCIGLCLGNPRAWLHYAGRARCCPGDNIAHRIQQTASDPSAVDGP